jgi:hypothetical protein
MSQVVLGSKGDLVELRLKARYRDGGGSQERGKHSNERLEHENTFEPQIMVIL